ncbi:DUF1684 domain-containing protein [Acidisoma cladoniae]|jgi:uncharacterized protein (DUF1684 family)|uniref:DUF1684 domain-containing protein n=1 Tax=Acidisoma cladoniae TaxID=3040935 RepID=UPI002551907A|nr:DUF1684 domain-containing protein [Acidisoma sp. PAMC 29798]
MSDIEDLWDWRRQVADLYADIRREPNPEVAWRQWVATRSRLFATHPQSPIDAEERVDYTGPKVFPYDPALRFTVGLVPATGGQIALPAGNDGSVLLDVFATTEGLQAALGGELTLYWIGGYGGGVFLPFADATSGRETYGAGRYLLDTIKSADLGAAPDGRLILDFNFAYAPSCAHSPRYICPLAPRENRLPAAIRAGEC